MTLESTPNDIPVPIVLPAGLGHSADSVLVRQANLMMEELRSALQEDWSAACRSARRLTALIASNAPSQRVTTGCGLAPWQVRKLTAFVEGHLDQTILVEDLADLVDLSPGHFCRSFKDAFDVTPHAYLIQARIRRAQSLMCATDESLSRIAVSCGLADQAHLTRLFRRLVGVTPSAWRRNLDQGEVALGASPPDA